MHHHFLDEHSDRSSFLHRLDPRTKITSFLVFVFFILLTPPRESLALAFYAGAILVLIGMSHVPSHFILTRSLNIAPFAFLVALSMALSSHQDRFFLAGFLLAKAVLAILVTVLLVATTKFVDLLKALEKMKVPSVFIMILSFMYRYIYLLLDEFMRMRQAQEARSVAWQASNLFRIRVFSNMVGNLLVRSYERGEEVYLAMCSRGYQGSIRTWDRLEFKKIDGIFFIVLLFFFMLAKGLCLYLLP